MSDKNMKSLLIILFLFLLPATLLAFTVPVKPPHKLPITLKFEPSQLENGKAPENILYKCDFSIVREGSFKHIIDITFFYSSEDSRCNMIDIHISCKELVQDGKVITTGSFLVRCDMISDAKSKLCITTPEMLGIGPYIFNLSDYFIIEPKSQANPLKR